MEIDVAVRRMLLQDTTIVGYVGTKVFKNELIEHVDGTSGRAIVVRRNIGWSPPDQVQTSEYPTVAVECWADVDRSPGGLKSADNAIDKAYAVARVVTRLMHRKRDVWWGAGGAQPGLRILTSMQDGEPVAETQKDAHNGVVMGESAVVTVQFDIHIAP